jgi:hypothetical protein
MLFTSSCKSVEQKSIDIEELKHVTAYYPLKKLLHPLNTENVQHALFVHQHLFINSYIYRTGSTMLWVI